MKTDINSAKARKKITSVIIVNQGLPKNQKHEKFP